MGTPVVYVTRRAQFSAGHRLHNPALSPEVNAALYGKCNNPNGHGHTYVLEATVRAPVEPASGRALGAAALEAVLRDAVVARLDGANLDTDLPELGGPTSTTELLGMALWRILAARLGPERLWRIRIEETPNNAFEYAGGREDEDRRGKGQRP